MHAMKLYSFLLFITLLCPVFSIFDNCCLDSWKLYYTVVRGSPNEKECKALEGSVRLRRGRNNFRMTVCKNGITRVGGSCGVGECNFIGCECEGGCHEGDPIENFVAAHPKCQFTDLRTQIR